MFGKPPRQSACECERSSSMMLGPVLSLVNGPVIGDAVRDPNNLIAKLLGTQKDDSKLVEELFLSVLNRPPTQPEINAGLKALKDGEPEFQPMMEEFNRRTEALEIHKKSESQRITQWEKSFTKVAEWENIKTSSASAKSKAKFTKLEDGSFLASGENPLKKPLPLKSLLINRLGLAFCLKSYLTTHCLRKGPVVRPMATLFSTNLKLLLTLREKSPCPFLLLIQSPLSTNRLSPSPTPLITI